MLVLSRRRGERILIGSDIEIVVTEVRGDRVKLGFECPSEVRVLREELQWRPSPRSAYEDASVPTGRRRECATVKGT